MKMRILATTTLAIGMSAAGMGTAAALPNDLTSFFAPPGKFYLKDQSDVEIIDYSKPKDITVCASRGTPPKTTPEDNHGPIALKAKYAGIEKIIQPGNCLMFEAKEVKVSPAEELPEGWIVEGTYSAD
ncbi:MAG: hypothetical protein GC201_15445 [Alphaproteobacteria bacterium]|nr:hypothetical protein [Alphaproteobacteria bacterium]